MSQIVEFFVFLLDGLLLVGLFELPNKKLPLQLVFVVFRLFVLLPVQPDFVDLGDLVGTEVVNGASVA